MHLAQHWLPKSLARLHTVQQNGPNRSCCLCTARPRFTKKEGALPRHALGSPTAACYLLADPGLLLHTLLPLVRRHVPPVPRSAPLRSDHPATSSPDMRPLSERSYQGDLVFCCTLYPACGS